MAESVSSIIDPSLPPIKIAWWSNILLFINEAQLIGDEILCALTTDDSNSYIIESSTNCL
jgi:hypothetical protein